MTQEFDLLGRTKQKLRKLLFLLPKMPISHNETNLQLWHAITMDLIDTIYVRLFFPVLYLELEVIWRFDGFQISLNEHTGPQNRTFFVKFGRTQEKKTKSKLQITNFDAPHYTAFIFKTQE